MATLKLSQIAAGGVPAASDQLVGVSGGATDNLFSLTNIATRVQALLAPPLTLTTTSAAISNSTTATALQVYNTVDSISAPTNFERGVFDWTTTANALTIGTQKGGAGLQREMDVVIGGTKVAVFGDTSLGNSDPRAIAYYGATANKNLVWSNNSYGAQPGKQWTLSWSATGIAFCADDLGQASWNFISPANWSAGANSVSDVGIMRPGAGLLAISAAVTGAHASGLQVYNNIDVQTGAPTNYERGVFDWTTSANVLTIGTQAGGTGTLRITTIVGFPKAGAPANTDLAAGTWALIDDTSGGQTWLVFNKAGTIRKVQLT